MNINLTTNPTKRKKIDKSAISISVTPKSKVSPVRFTVTSCDLSKFEFPEDAKVWLWTYTKYDEDHHDMGTISHLKLPIAKEIDVSGPISRMQFRVDVFKEGNAQLLGQAEAIKAIDTSNENQLQSLFDCDVVPLGNEMWRLQLDDGEKPLLQINDDDQLLMCERLEEPGVWRTLIFPEAIRQTLRYLVKHPVKDEGDLDLWQNKWSIWIKQIDGTEIPSQEDENFEEWVQGVVKSFADKNDLKNQVVNEIGKSRR